MTRPSVSEAFLGFDLDLWLYLGTGLLVFTRFWNVIYIKFFPVDTGSTRTRLLKHAGSRDGPGAPAGTQLYDYEIFNFTAVVFYCTLLLTWNASKVQFHHTARRVFAYADGHHRHAWILNLVC